MSGHHIEANRQSLPPFECLQQTSLESRCEPGAIVGRLRDEFLSTGYKLNGAIPKDPDRDERIHLFIQESTLVAHATQRFVPLGNFTEASKRLLQCFERLAYRTRTPIPDHISRDSIYQYLIDQLACNTEFFSFNPKVLVTATLMSRHNLREIVGPDVFQDSGELRRLLYRAFAAYPQSIDRFFARGKERLEELTDILNRDGTTMARSFQVLYAYFKIGFSVEEVVKQHFTLVDEMCADEGFSSLSRSIIESVVGRCKPRCVRRELERIVKDSQDLLDDPEVSKVFGSRMHHVRYVVSSRVDDAREYLLRAAVQEERICALYRALGETFNRKELRDQCVKNPGGAQSLESLLEHRLIEESRTTVQDATMPTWML